MNSRTQHPPHTTIPHGFLHSPKREFGEATQVLQERLVRQKETAARIEQIDDLRQRLERARRESAAQQTAPIPAQRDSRAQLKACSSTRLAGIMERAIAAVDDVETKAVFKRMLTLGCSEG